ncbi:MAG TPA: hypothetical protein PLC15_09405 [Candidatus Obscuribacter sp.]|nr:hypothetical protein [Candidatus Obscuribacter sp.]
MALVWNDHLSAQVTLVGMSLDLIGGLYLAYDLLGGDKGPLSTLTRCVTYSVIVIACVGFSMGLKFGLLAGAGLGIALGLHLERIGRGQKETTAFLFALGLVRALGISAACWFDNLKSVAYCAIPIVLVAALVLPKLKLTPSHFYEVGKRPSFSWRKLALAVTLGLMAGSLGVFTSLLQHDLSHMSERVIRLGLTMAMTSAIVSSLIPLIEWYADNVPGRTMGYIGASLFVLGFMVQAIPSLVAVLK